MVKHHLQQRHQIVRLGATSTIRLLDRRSIELVDLPFDELGMVILFKSSPNFLPLRILLGKRKTAKTGFLTALAGLHSWLTSVWSMD